MPSHVFAVGVANPQARRRSATRRSKRSRDTECMSHRSRIDSQTGIGNSVSRVESRQRAIVDQITMGYGFVNGDVGVLAVTASHRRITMGPEVVEMLNSPMHQPWNGETGNMVRCGNRCVGSIFEVRACPLQCRRSQHVQQRLDNLIIQRAIADGRPGLKFLYQCNWDVSKKNFSHELSSTTN